MGFGHASINAGSLDSFAGFLIVTKNPDVDSGYVDHNVVIHLHLHFWGNYRAIHLFYPVLIDGLVVRLSYYGLPPAAGAAGAALEPPADGLNAACNPATTGSATIGSVAAGTESVSGFATMAAIFACTAHP